MTSRFKERETMKLLKLVPDNTNIKFLKLRVPFFVLSLVLIFGSWAAVAVNGLNFGVDFAGGQEVRMTFQSREAAPIASLREQIGGLGYGEPVVQEFGAPNQVSVRVPLPDGAENTPGAAKAIGEKVIAAIKGAYPDARVDGNDTVSGKVAGEFRDSAILALLAAMGAVSVYIWVRFEWQFGVGAMFALVHDVSVTLGLFALTGMEFTLQIVAAILAIIGYSLNDTIVVYDRIRENLKKYRKMDLGDLLDLSVNETLARTVMTSLTLFVALIPLLFFGPPSLFGMVAAITVGLFIGTYSSIYMAGPLLIWMGVTSSSFVPTETALDKQDKIARGEV
jgi:preprotein translocase subunit SecF